MKCSDMIDRPVIDQSAETAFELEEATGFSRCTVLKMCASNIRAGLWEIVKKKQRGRIVPAYRVKAGAKARQAQRA